MVIDRFSGKLDLTLDQMNMNSACPQNVGFQISLPDAQLLIVMERHAVTRHLSRIIKSDSFSCQQSPLHLEASLIAAKAPVRAYGSVTWYDEGKRIPRQSIPNGPCAVSFVEMRRNALIGTDTPPWNSMLCTQNPLLKWRAQRQVGKIKRERDILSFKKSCYGISDMIDLLT
jgi:hypothetical protein